MTQHRSRLVTSVWLQRARYLGALQPCLPPFSSTFSHFQSIENLLGEEASVEIKTKNTVNSEF